MASPQPSGGTGGLWQTHGGGAPIREGARLETLSSRLAPPRRGPLRRLEFQVKHDSAWARCNSAKAWHRSLACPDSSSRQSSRPAGAVLLGYNAPFGRPHRQGGAARWFETSHHPLVTLSLLHTTASTCRPCWPPRLPCLGFRRMVYSCRQPNLLTSPPSLPSVQRPPNYHARIAVILMTSMATTE